MTPGAKLRTVIEEGGFDQIRFAEALNVSRQTINNIVNSRQAISRDMANKLARMTGHTPGYWLQGSFPDEPPTGPFAQVSSFASGVLVDSQIIAAIQTGTLQIEPFDSELVQAASIDLRLDDFISLADEVELDISGGGSFELEPGKAVNVKTREHVSFPETHIGRVGSTTNVARFGIIMAHGFQIDPGFAGHLQFSLFNASSKSYQLVSGTPIVSIEIVALAARPSGTRKATSHDRGEVVRHFHGPAPDFPCDDAIRTALRGLVNVHERNGHAIAQIKSIDVDVVGPDKETATDSAVDVALTTLRTLSQSSDAGVMGDRYRDFFGDLAERVYLDATMTRRTAHALGFVTSGQIVDFRNGEFLTLPSGFARITLAALVFRSGRPATQIILKLMRPMNVAGDAAAARSA